MKFQVAVFLLFSASCTSKYSSSSPLDTLTDEQKEGIVVENANLRHRVELLEHQIDSLQMVSLRQSFQPTTVSKPYAFILMEVEQNDKYQINQRVGYYRVSDVLEVGELDSDGKYRLLDQFQSKYMSSPDGSVTKGKLDQERYSHFLRTKKQVERGKIHRQ